MATMRLRAPKNNRVACSRGWSLAPLAPLAPLAMLAMLAMLAGCAARNPGAGAGAQAEAGIVLAPDAPLETRRSNGAGYQPSFPGQARVKGIRNGVVVDVAVVSDQLSMPWAVEPLPGGSFLVTERAGALRLLSADGKQLLAVAGLPPLHAQGQAGLHDVALDPAFASNGMIYFSYTEAQPGGYSETLARARLVSDAAGASLQGVLVLFRQMPVHPSERQMGSRIVFGADNKLYFAMGERGEAMEAAYAQDLHNHFGKVVRLNPDGTVPLDNPFAGRGDVRAEVWTYGHRNVQSFAMDAATGKLWTIEHGPRGGDELNLLKPGANYGWPVISYGIDYSGAPVGAGVTQKEGMEQPAYYWDPVIAPSGMIVYRGPLFPEWQGSIFVGGLSGLKLVRLQMDGDSVVGEEWLLADQYPRVRDVQQDAAGAIYVLAEQGNASRLLKLTPRR
jgi:aldose sugar dehydrogenase